MDDEINLTELAPERGESRVMTKVIADVKGSEVLPLFANLQTQSMPRLVTGAAFLETVRTFTFNGERTAEWESAGLRYFVNEFWTAGQRQAHSLHEISYRAMFKPQLPRFFIERLTANGDTVYDPFSGRGTTALEAALLRRRPIANDVNPLSAMLVRPRFTPPSFNAVAARLRALGLNQPCATDTVSDLLVFYHPETLREICVLRSYLLERAASGRLDNIDDWIRMVAVNRLTGHSPGFFSVYTLPPNQAVSIDSQQKINAKRNQTPPRRAVADLMLKKTKTLLTDGAPPAHPAAILMTRSAHQTPTLHDGEVDLVVTSPPFLDVVDYEGDNWLRCWFAGVDARSVQIAKHKDIRVWEALVRDTFTELGRVVRPGGVVAFEVGDVRGGKILLERHVVDAIRGLPFKVLGVMVNQQEFTKTANCWGVSNNTRGTNTNRIVLAERFGEGSAWVQ